MTISIDEVHPNPLPDIHAEEWKGPNGAMVSLTSFEANTQMYFQRARNLSGFRNAVVDVAAYTGMPLSRDERKDNDPEPVMIVTSPSRGEGLPSTVEVFDGRQESQRWFGMVPNGTEGKDGYRILETRDMHKDMPVHIAPGDTVYFGLVRGSVTKAAAGPDKPALSLFTSVEEAIRERRVSALRRFLLRNAPRAY